MANTLVGPFDPIEFAQETLEHLRSSLRFGARVHRGYDRTSRNRGETISIGSPAKFTVQDAPSAAQDVLTSETQVKLDYWKEVKFGFTDKEASLSRQDVLDIHIRPAAYALANYIDTSLAALALQTPWTYPVSSPNVTVADIANARAVLRTNGVPFDDVNMFGVVDPTLEAQLLTLPAFHSYDTAGQNAQNPLLSGSLGRRLGFEWSADQNVNSFTAGNLGAGVGAIDAASGLASGISSMTVDGLTAAKTIRAGESFTIAGNSQKYVVMPTYDSNGVVTTSTYTTSGGGAVTFPFGPGLVQAHANNDAVTFSNLPNHSANVLFHRHAFALAMAPLNDEQLRRLGVNSQTVFDEESNLALRLTQWADPNTSKILAKVDVLYGLKILDPNKAVRFIR